MTVMLHNDQNEKFTSVALNFVLFCGRVENIELKTANCQNMYNILPIY